MRWMDEVGRCLEVVSIQVTGVSKLPPGPSPLPLTPAHAPEDLSLPSRRIHSVVQSGKINTKEARAVVERPLRGATCLLVCLCAHAGAHTPGLPATARRMSKQLWALACEDLAHLPGKQVGKRAFYFKKKAGTSLVEQW